jgi:sugar/nucleoside kinase (ribokinase family)
MPVPRLLAVGLNVVDILVQMPAEVRHGDKHPVDHLVVQGGGPAGNAACTAAALGVPTAIAARMGTDTLSAIARAELARCGVGAGALIEDPGARPAVSVIQIDPATGERTIFYNTSGYRPLRPGDLSPERFGRPELVIVDAYDPAGARMALERAREVGAASVLDLEAGPAEELWGLLGLGTDAVLPRAAAERLTGVRGAGPAARELALRVPTAVVTDGARGSWGVSGETSWHQPAFPAAVVDTTGCGDAYHGAYAVGRLLGWPLAVRMEFAAFIAARVAGAFGGRADPLTPAGIRGMDLSGLSPALVLALRDLP